VRTRSLRDARELVAQLHTLELWQRPRPPARATR
jgi:hypothetical protein